MRVLAAAFAALFLAGCYQSQKALFGEDDAVIPIRDGAVYELRSNPKDEPPRQMRFTRVGDTYELRMIGDDKNPPMRILVASIIQTHDDDYIMQVDMNRGAGNGFVYWFLWPMGDDRYWMIQQASTLDTAGKRTFDRCAESLSGCTFNSADDLRRYYMEVLYPMLSSGRRPEDFQEMNPVEQAAPAHESST